MSKSAILPEKILMKSATGMSLNDRLVSRCQCYEIVSKGLLCVLSN